MRDFFKTIFIAILILIHNNTYSDSRYISKHDVDVLHWYEEKNGKHYYFYHLFNRSSESSIVGFQLGYDWKNGFPRLYAPRADITHKPLKFFSPVGWKGRVEYTEETHYYNLYWEVGENSEHDIQKGESTYRFGIELSNKRDDHLNTVFTVIFGDSTVTTKQVAGSESKSPKSLK